MATSTSPSSTPPPSGSAPSTLPPSAGIGIDAIEIDPTGKRLYVATTDAHGSSLVVVDAETARIERTLWIGSPIRDLAFADGTAYVLTSDRARGGMVHVIDLSTNRITYTVELGVGTPTQMTLSPDKTRAYIVDYDHVAVLCTLSLEVVNTLTVDARPSCVAVDSDGGLIYVADYSGGVTMHSRSPRPCRCCTRSSWRPTRSARPQVRELESPPPDAAVARVSATGSGFSGGRPCRSPCGERRCLRRRAVRGIATRLPAIRRPAWPPRRR